MSMRGIVVETLKLPPLRPLARRAYDHFFARQRAGNHYRGTYTSYAQALAHVPATVTAGYNNTAAAAKYRNRASHLGADDYPVLFWLSRLIDAGQRRIFDLGGHFGVAYYAFQKHQAFPAELRWTVCDLPLTVASGRDWAQQHDPRRQLQFTERKDDASGQDVLLILGALQYFDYSLSDWLATLDQPPGHVIVNLTPLHPSLDFHTVQNMGFCCTPYHVLSLPEFVGAMQACGYAVVEEWHLDDRQCHIPFAPDHDVEFYTGIYFKRVDDE